MAGGREVLQWGVGRASDALARRRAEDEAQEAQRQSMAQRVMDSGFQALNHLISSGSDQDKLDRQLKAALAQDAEKSRLRAGEDFQRRAHELALERLRIGAGERKDQALLAEREKDRGVKRAAISVQRERVRNQVAGSGANPRVDALSAEEKDRQHLERLKNKTVALITTAQSRDLTPAEDKALQAALTELADLRARLNAIEAKRRGEVLIDKQPELDQDVGGGAVQAEADFNDAP